MAKRKTRLRDLPKGLQEFLGTIELDDKFTAELLGRLCDLPGAGKTPLAKVLEEWSRMQAKVHLLEELTTEARHKARSQAVSIFKACVDKWTVKQLQKATGYDDE
jgi:hypothetical protein